VKLWPLLHRPPLRTWHTGKLLFIGDAAHPMLPRTSFTFQTYRRNTLTIVYPTCTDQGQAGAQAIEDACALGLLLEGIGPADVNVRLRLYEKVRMGRTGAVQIFSRFGQDQADRVKREVEKIDGWKGTVPGKEKNPVSVLPRHTTICCLRLHAQSSTPSLSLRPAFLLSIQTQPL
jgi:hypothetical protein